MSLFLSYLFGQISKIKRPRLLSQLLIFLFSRAFKISFEESKKKKFESLYDMFTREINRDLSHIKAFDFSHPADGQLVSFGQVKEGQIFLVKGKNYSLKDLLGEEQHAKFKNHYFYNYYLSPKDYHRVHHPVSGVYTDCYRIKGALYPVAGWFVKLCPSVFAKNARTVSLVETANYGLTATVMVGALNVGSLEMKRGFFRGKNHEVSAADHLGTFGLGSSVVVFTKKALNVKLGPSFFGHTLKFEK